MSVKEVKQKKGKFGGNLFSSTRGSIPLFSSFFPLILKKSNFYHYRFWIHMINHLHMTHFHHMDINSMHHQEMNGGMLFYHQYFRIQHITRKAWVMLFVDLNQINNMRQKFNQGKDLWKQSQTDRKYLSISDFCTLTHIKFPNNLQEFSWIWFFLFFLLFFSFFFI